MSAGGHNALPIVAAALTGGGGSVLVAFYLGVRYGRKERTSGKHRLARHPRDHANLKE